MPLFNPSSIAKARCKSFIRMLSGRSWLTAASTSKFTRWSFRGAQQLPLHPESGQSQSAHSLQPHSPLLPHLHSYFLRLPQLRPHLSSTS
mmetsp:Transcript_2612/g.6098  ORF Transcript_2612/g.6098 Transcript_2612/m.6098 type:complete len:90 (+) Transcript_2612:312-581(+)